MPIMFSLCSLISTKTVNNCAVALTIIYPRYINTPVHEIYIKYEDSRGVSLIITTPNLY